MWKHYLVGSFNKERALVGVLSAGSLNSLLFRDCEIFAELRFQLYSTQPSNTSNKRNSPLWRELFSDEEEQK